MTFLLPAVEMEGQNPSVEKYLRIADSLRMEYDFHAAVEYYEAAIEAEPDTTKHPPLEDRKLLGENGASMMDFVYKPVVVAKEKFSVKDFFLYYPMKDKSWRAVPNMLDSLDRHPYAKALYFPEDEEEVYFSAEDETGVRNIWMTEFMDTIWSAPALLNEQVTTTSDEIYPTMSYDGKYLYFASAGLYGMGGYDLYVSTWNSRRKRWETPENMGFPYSSPYDDILFAESEDGKYVVFASNRECSSDSLYVYVLEADSMPIRSAVESPEELRELMKLEPSRPEGPRRDEEPDVPENVDTKRYTDKMAEVRALKDSVYACGVAMDEVRSRYAMSDDVEERASLTEEIMKYEIQLPRLRSSLDKASSELQEIEMEFLFNGVVIDPDKVNAAADREMLPPEPRFRFEKKTMGEALDIDIEPSNRFDYTFMILPEGRFAQDNTLPNGVVYQIQIFSSVRKSSVSELRGLSPVFVRQASGRYTYTVGLFRTYSEVLSCLNKVKKVGFKTAFIVAFLDGKSVSVDTARTMEK